MAVGMMTAHLPFAGVALRLGADLSTGFPDEALFADVPLRRHPKGQEADCNVSRLDMLRSARAGCRRLLDLPHLSCVVPLGSARGCRWSRLRPRSVRGFPRRGWRTSSEGRASGAQRMLSKSRVGGNEKPSIRLYNAAGGPSISSGLLYYMVQRKIDCMRCSLQIGMDKERANPEPQRSLEIGTPELDPVLPSATGKLDSLADLGIQLFRDVVSALYLLWR